MRKALLLLAVFGLAGSLWAADPIIGTWKLDLPKSKFPPTEVAPKEHTEVYREINDSQIDFTEKRIQGDGSPSLFKATWPREGGVVTAPEGQLPEGKSYVELLIEPGHWYVIVLQDGKQIGMIHKIVSKDRKTMRQTLKSLDAQGKQLEVVMVFDRQ